MEAHPRAGEAARREKVVTRVAHASPFVDTPRVRPECVPSGDRRHHQSGVCAGRPLEEFTQEA
jgi:hypothetical protein